MSIFNSSTQISDVKTTPSKSNSPQQNAIDAQSQELKNSLKSLIDFYFSKDNLRTDDYLVSKMNNEMFVPIQAVLELEKIKALTTDYVFILNTLRETDSVILDQTEKKVKPNITLQRNTLLLRELPNGVTEQEIRNLFDENCPPLVSIRLDIGNNWFLVYKTEPDALRMSSYLREKTIRGQDISIRIKSESILRGTYNSQSVNPSIHTLNNQSQYGPILQMNYHPVIPPYPYQYYPFNYTFRPEAHPEPYYFQQMYSDPSYKDYPQGNGVVNHNQNRSSIQYRPLQQYGQPILPASNPNYRNYHKNQHNPTNSHSGTYDRRQRDDRNYRRNDTNSSSPNRHHFNNYRPNNQHYQKREKPIQSKPEPEITQESFPPLSSSSETVPTRTKSSNFVVPMSQVVKNLKQSKSLPVSSNTKAYNTTKNSNINKDIPYLDQRNQTSYPKHQTKDNDDLNQLNSKLDQLTISQTSLSNSYASILKQKALEQAKVQSHSSQFMKQTQSK